MEIQTLNSDGQDVHPSCDEYEKIRLAWLNDLLKPGLLTDHSQTMPDDHKYDHLTTPAFKYIDDLKKKYSNSLSQIKPRLGSESNLPDMPDWYHKTCEQTEMEGGSARQMQSGCIKELKNKTTFKDECRYKTCPNCEHLKPRWRSASSNPSPNDNPRDNPSDNPSDKPSDNPSDSESS